MATGVIWQWRWSRISPPTNPKQYVFRLLGGRPLIANFVHITLDIDTHVHQDEGGGDGRELASLQWRWWLVSYPTTQGCTSFG